MQGPNVQLKHKMLRLGQSTSHPVKASLCFPTRDSLSLKSAIVGASDQDGSDADDIAQSLAPYLFYQLGEEVDVTLTAGQSIQLNIQCLIVKTITGNTGNIQIDGVKCTKRNAYRSTVDGNYYYNSYIGQSGSIVTNSSTNTGNEESFTIVPFLNVAGEQLENSDFYYSATLNLKDFYDKFTNNTLSTYSTLFNQLGINTKKTHIETETFNETLFYKEFTIACKLSEMYNVVITPSLSTKAYMYYIDNETLQKKGLWNLRFRANGKMMKFPHTGTSTRSYYKMEDINFNITISKLYEYITDTETE